MVFLLRGTAVLMPLPLILPCRGPRAADRARGLAALAIAAFLVPTGLWAVARWRVDQWQFFEKLWSYDLVARSLLALEGHGGGVFFYLDVLQKYQVPDWLFALALVVVLRPPSMDTLRGWITFWRSSDPYRASSAGGPSSRWRFPR